MAVRRAGIGKCWADIWDTDAWTLYVWEPPLLYTTGNRPRTQNTDLRTLVVTHDKQHSEPVVEYEFSHGRNFYGK